MTRLWRASAIAAGAWLGLVSTSLAQPAAPPPPPAITTPSPAPAPQPGDPFGEAVTLTAKTIVFVKGTGTWNNALETLVDAYKSLYAYLDKQGIKPVGPAMTIYTSANDTGFEFQAAVPIGEAPKDKPQGDIAVGQSPAGKALKFTHRGSYDSMDNTYEAITNYLDEKQLEAQDLFVEEYRTDLLNTPEDKLEIDIYVPLK